MPGPLKDSEKNLTEIRLTKSRGKTALPPDTVMPKYVPDVEDSVLLKAHLDQILKALTELSNRVHLSEQKLNHMRVTPVTFVVTYPL